jgi:hypothetical protein
MSAAIRSLVLCFFFKFSEGAQFILLVVQKKKKMKKSSLLLKENNEEMRVLRGHRSKPPFRNNLGLINCIVVHIVVDFGTCNAS